MVDISVVVCTKNEEKNIEKCLKCLKNQTIKPEIIVVDASSTDNTRKIAKKYTKKVVLDNKKGLGEARNIGFKHAKGKVIAYCDADVRPPKNWTKNILKSIKNYGCVSGPLKAYDGDKVLRATLNFWAGTFPVYLAKVGYHNTWGANMAFKKEILKKHKFRVSFLEDYDMNCRLRKKGLVFFTEKLRVPASSRRFKDEGFYEVCKDYLINAYKISMNKNISTKYWDKKYQK